MPMISRGRDRRFQICPARLMIVVLCSLLVVSATSVSAHSAPVVPRCASSQLQLSLVRIQAATSHRFWDLALRNTGSRTCRLQDFPGVGLLSRSGRLLPTRVERMSGFARSAVIVRPGQRGFFTFSYVVRGPCGSRFFTAFGIQVIAPNQRAHVRPNIARRIDVCNVSVAGHPLVYPLRRQVDLQ